MLADFLNQDARYRARMLRAKAYATFCLSERADFIDKAEKLDALADAEDLRALRMDQLDLADQAVAAARTTVSNTGLRL